MSGPLLRDAKWVRQAFLVQSKDMDKLSVQNRTSTSASQKFEDTTPGGNRAINPPPQFTRYADPKATVVNSNGDSTDTYSSYAASRGMGVYYSEAIDDNAQVINLRFGVPEFNSLATFFTGFYDSAAGQLARTGRGKSIFYTLGTAAGFIVSIMYWPILVANVLGSGLRFFLQKPSSKFYYLKPTMPVYWSAVETMLNHIAVNTGVVPRIGGDDKAGRFGEPYEFTSEALQLLSTKMPDIFRPGGGIDVFATANRAQRLAAKKRDNLRSAIGGDTLGDLTKAVQSYEGMALEDKKPNFLDYMKKWWDATPSKTKTPDGKTDLNTESANTTPEGTSGWLDFLEAEMNDGGAFASFAVNSTGKISESFSSQVGESDVAQKINSVSSSSRATNFNFAGGNLFGGVAGDILGGIASATKDSISGIANGLNISGVAALGGAAFVDIPQHWQSSIANLPSASYTINLRSWSGDPISRLLNIFLPLSMLLCGALPLSTGKHSYTSPFICELYDQGRCQIRLGIIDSMQVSRGEGNLGFDADGRPMGIDVTFTVKDLSSIMHMPISEHFNWNASTAGAQAGAVAGVVVGGVGGAAAGAVVGGTAGAAVDAVSAIGAAVKGAFSDDTSFSDYIATLSAMSLPDQIYSWRKLKLNVTLQLKQLDSFFSASHYAAFVGDTPTANLMKILYRGTTR